jgi:hypothetical protein
MSSRTAFPLLLICSVCVLLLTLDVSAVFAQCTYNSTTDSWICGSSNDNLALAMTYNGYVNLDGGNDTFTLLSSGRIGNEPGISTDGVIAGDGDDSVTISGTVIGSVGIDAGSGSDVIVINSTGRVISNNYGLYISGQDSVTNYGSINAYYGVYVVGGVLGTTGVTVINQGGGTITSGAIGIYGDAGDDTLTNNGLINAPTGMNGWSGNDRFTNNGTLTGDVVGGLGNDTLHNYELLQDVWMSDGNDIVYNDDGDTITGYVDMGTGNDTLLNFGSIGGNVILGDGVDSLYNAGLGSATSLHARLIGGAFGGAGNDTMVNSLYAAIGGIDGGPGNDSIRNHSLVYGVMVGGDGDDVITNYGGGMANYLGGDIGSDSVTNGGMVNTSLTGYVGNDTITNCAGAVASWLDGGDDHDRVLNGGFVNADLIGGAGNDSVVNLAGAFVAMMYGNTGQDTVINGGFLNGTAYGGDDNDIVVNLGGAQATHIAGENGSDSVFNGGYLVGQLYGGYGNDTVVNAAYSYSAGAYLGPDNDQFLNGGYLNGSVYGGLGADQFTMHGYTAGGIYGEDGNDTVYLIGGTVIGLINGGPGSDVLTFQFTYTGSPAQIAAISAAFAAASPAGGTISIGAQTFTWINFEYLYNLMTLIAMEPGTEVTISIPAPQRLNADDLAAPVAVYCVSGAIEIWAIDAGGAGHFAFSVAAADVTAGTTVSADGIVFTSEPGGAFTVTATGHDGKPYAFSGRCS